MTSAVSEGREAGWLSLSELARRLNLSVSAVKKRVDRLDRQGLLETRVEGSRRLVEFERFRAVTAATVNALKTAGGVFEGDGADLAAEQLRKLTAQADLAQIQVDKARGLLIPITDVEDAMARAAGEIVRVLEALPGRAAEFADAVAQDGVIGSRRVLKEVVRDVRERLASSMALLRSGEGVDDDMIRFEDAKPASKAETKPGPVAAPHRVEPKSSAETKPATAPSKGGRPPKYVVKPWEARGISRAAFYREQAKAGA